MRTARMVASVAHDLRTPLTALHGHLEALVGKPLGGTELDHRNRGHNRDRVLAAALAQSDEGRRRAAWSSTAICSSSSAP